MAVRINTSADFAAPRETKENVLSVGTAVSYQQKILKIRLNLNAMTNPKIIASSEIDNFPKIGSFGPSQRIVCPAREIKILIRIIKKIMTKPKRSVCPHSL